MPVALDIQTNGWEDTRGEGGRILTRDVGDYIVIPWRNLQFFGSTTGTGTGTSYQAGGFNESWTGYGSALLISVGDDSAGSGIAVRMLVWGSIFGVAVQSELSATDQPPAICTGVDHHYRRHVLVDRWLYYRNKRTGPPISSFNDYVGHYLHATDLDPSYPHLCELIVPGDRSQGGVARNLRTFGIIVSRRAGNERPTRAGRFYSYDLTTCTGFPGTLTPSTADRIKRGEATARDGLAISAIILENTDTVARTVVLRNGSRAARTSYLAAAGSDAANETITFPVPIAPANDLYLFTGEANTTTSVIASVVVQA